MFLIRNIFFRLGLYHIPTVIATGRNCRGELGGCTSTLVLQSSWRKCHGILKHFFLGDGLLWVTDVTTLQSDWTGLFFVSAILLSTFILLFLLSSSVSLSYLYLAVPMRGCWGKHSCMSSPFPIAILNGTCSLRALILFCGDVPAIKN